MASDWRASAVLSDLAQMTGTHITAIIVCLPIVSPPPVPIIDSVQVAVLSLFEVEVNISLLTNGGQSVTQYTVSPFTCVLNRPWLEGKTWGL